MSDGFNVRIVEDEITPALKRVLDATGNLKPAMQAIGEHLLRSTDDNFAKQRGPDGRPWKPLKVISYHLAYTLGKKKRTHTKTGGLTAGFQSYIGSRKILTDSGELRGSIKYSASRTRLEIGSGKVYSAINQFGGKAGRGRKVTIPARPYLGIGATDRIEILATLKNYLEGAIRS